MTWLVMASWDSTEVASHCLSQVPGWGSISLNLLFAWHPLRVRLLLMGRERWIFDNREVILTLIIHWLGPPLFLLWYPEATLTIGVKGLLKSHTRKAPHYH